MPDTATRLDAARSELASILADLRRHLPDADEEPIIRAYDLAQRTHAGQFRLSGDPFITHPIAVAQMLAFYGLDVDSITAALLHDTVEDTDLTLQEVQTQFGATVARIIDGVTKLDRIKFDLSREEAEAETVRKMMVAMAQDVRVLIIKLADRLHNLRTIFPLPDERKRAKAWETLEILAPLAHRLGFQEIKHEMENRCFQILYPGRYKEIDDQIAHRAPEREMIIEKVIDEIKGMLAEAGMEATLSGRPKHHYSIYRKMMDSHLSFEDIYDLIGVRLLVNEVPDCYAALGLIHSAWAPVQGRFKDYLAMPKFNLYQSLHTTVIGPDGKPLEVQIRTHEMHARAEFGIAAHWRYKEGRSSEQLPWIADMRRLWEEHPDPESFLANLKLDLYQDEVFVLTPQGEVRTMPRGATPVDFAYTIHTEVGHRCVGAKVNGRLVTLATKLVSGDIVEIITTKSTDYGPTRDWLGFVRTSRARSKINQWFSRTRREHSLQDGKISVRETLRREKMQIPSEDRTRLLTDVASALGFPEVDVMYRAVGDGAISPRTVAARLRRLIEEPEDLSVEPVAYLPRRPERPGGEGVIVEGLDDVWVRIARCCSPVPGDPVTGFVTVGRGVSVHGAECSNLDGLGSFPERLIEVSWAPDAIKNFTVWLQVEALDRPKLLTEVTQVISEAGGNIVASSTRTDRDRVAVLRYEVELSDAAQVEGILRQMRGVASVYEAMRLRTSGNQK